MEVVWLDIKILGVVIIAFIANFLGKYFLERIQLPRIVCWFVVLIPFAITHLYLIDVSVFGRMVGLCIVLLLGMKLIIYREWLADGGKPFTKLKWIGFAWLWFGMEPRAWISEKRDCEWQSHIQWGLSCVAIGAIGMTGLCKFEVGHFIPYFICMSMIFHFGILRLLTGFWRWNGIPVRVLFRNPLKLKGFRDFWSKRWNLAYSHMMARAVQRPLRNMLGEKGSVFAVFLISGLFHELAITVPAQAGYGLPTLFFIVHGIAAILERNFWWQRYACFTLLVVGLPILFPAKFVNEVVWPLNEMWNLWIR